MERIEKQIEVEAPLRAVYNQWTQFEEFPRFMEGIKSVRQLDDTHLRWQANIGGRDVEWDAEIIDQTPDRRIVWRSTSGAKNGGKVEFEAIGETRTRLLIVMEYDPEGAIEHLGGALGVPARRVEDDLERFKTFIEGRGTETAGGKSAMEKGRGPMRHARERTLIRAKAEAATDACYGIGRSTHVIGFRVIRMPGPAVFVFGASLAS
jgi:uncharacterized membrane protein